MALERKNFVLKKLLRQFCGCVTMYCLSIRQKRTSAMRKYERIKSLFFDKGENTCQLIENENSVYDPDTVTA